MRQGQASPEVVCTGRGFHLFRHCADVGPRQGYALGQCYALGQGYALVRARSTNIAGLLTSVLFFRSSKISDNETYTYGYDAQEGQYGDLVSRGVIGPTKVVSLFQNGRPDDASGLPFVSSACVRYNVDSLFPLSE